MHKERVDMDVAMKQVYATLSTGAKNAVSRKHIVERTGYTDRIVRECIERLRADEPIISATDGSGYYIATKDMAGVADVTRWMDGQLKRASSIRKSTEGAVKLILEVNYGKI